ncbi:hypothetical protein RhiirB3_457731 [Rhizophagus irregularis]|nr:hypothetical protein RhiirB3_457731 [Rhizophagus irregularis]
MPKCQSSRRKNWDVRGNKLERSKNENENKYKQKESTLELKCGTECQSAKNEKNKEMKQQRNEKKDIPLNQKAKMLKNWDLRTEKS